MIYYNPPGLILPTAMPTGIKIGKMPEDEDWYSLVWSRHGWHTPLTACISRGCPSLEDIANVQAQAAPPVHDFDYPYPPGSDWYTTIGNAGTPDIPIPFPEGHVAEATVAHFQMVSVRLVWALHVCKADLMNAKMYQLDKGGKGGLLG